MTVRVLDWNICGTVCWAPKDPENQFPGVDMRGDIVHRERAVKSAATTFKASIVSLQEVCFSQIKAFATFMGRPWTESFQSESRQSRCQGSDKRFGSGVLAKGRQTNLRHWRLPPVGNQSNWVQCTDTIGVTACNTHIEAHVVEAKQAQIEAVMKAVLTRKGNTLLTGDFNKTYDSHTMRNLVYSQLREVDETNNEPTVPATNTKIDYIFANGRPNYLFGDAANYGPHSVSNHRLLRGVVTW